MHVCISPLNVEIKFLSLIVNIIGCMHETCTNLIALIHTTTTVSHIAGLGNNMYLATTLMQSCTRLLTFIAIHAGVVTMHAPFTIYASFSKQSDTVYIWLICLPWFLQFANQQLKPYKLQAMRSYLSVFGGRTILPGNLAVFKFLTLQLSL